MKNIDRRRLITVLVSMCFCILGIKAALSNSIQEWELQENKVYSVATHPMTTLTVFFPEEIESLKGVGFVKDSQEHIGEYICSFNPGDNHFSIIPLEFEVEPRNLNIISEGKVYVLKIYITKDPDDSLAVIKFKKPINQNAIEQEERENNGESEDIISSYTSFIDKKNYLPRGSEKNDQKTVTINKLISMMDLLKVIGGMKEADAKAIVSKFQDLKFKENITNGLDFGLYSIHLKYILRNEALDAIGFCFLITNKSQGELLVDPESLCVRVGNHVYQQCISDLQPKLKKLETALGYFVIQGDGEGSKNYLTLNNDFKISIDILDPLRDENL